MYSLKSIICLSTIPPETSDTIMDYSQDMRDDGFLLIPEEVVLIVPLEAYDNYARHEYWGKFEIECICFSDD